ncbi:MAG: type 4a pilus secretin PilQ [Gammaproteobacteria bacterium]|nr:MAG: type 4a pilus secretin PilQ [Gammaproteobacteria bacterium]
MNAKKILSTIRNRLNIAVFLSTVLLVLTGISSVYAAEVKSLSWKGGDTPTLYVKVKGDVKYETLSLEDGFRLRLILPNTKLGKKVKELEGKDYIKGVFPYLAENGTAVNVDLLMTKAGRLQIKKVRKGFHIVALPGAGTTTSGTDGGRTRSAARSGQNVIKEVSYSKLPGDRIQLTIRMAKRPAKPNTFTITNPARIAMDFPKTRVGLNRKSMRVGEGALLTVSTIEAADRTRVVLSLIDSVAYKTSIHDNVIDITLDSPSSVIGKAARKRQTRFTSRRKGGRYQLQDIDFRRGPAGDAKIVMKLSDPEVGINITEQAGEIILDFINTTVRGKLQRRLDVVDFATPVQTIDTFQEGKRVRMIITPKGKYEHIAYQTGNIFTVNVRPIIEKEGEKKKDEFGYSGDKLSLNFQNISARAALQVLADFTGLNFVISDTVRGNLTLRLKDVPWDQALDLILDVKNLAMRRKGNVVTIAPAIEVARKEKAANAASKSILELEPLRTELIQINYAKAGEIATLLKSIKAVSSGSSSVAHPVFGPSATGQGVQAATDSNTLLSPRGQVSVDTRTNSLLIQDVPSKIKEVRKLIAKIDRPVRQVMIETRIVEAQDNFKKELGVKFGIKNANVNNAAQGQHNNAVSGNITDSANIINNGGINAADAGGLNVDFGVSDGGSIGFTLARLGATGNLLNLELSALQTENKLKIISSPRVITANQKKAKIESGSEQVFTTTVLGAGSVVTKRATLKLEVTPQITPDDRINMEVNITKDDFADVDRGLLNINEIDTQVLLDNGETVVIGGIYTLNRSTNYKKVPFFGDIPLLGWLFRSKTSINNKTELLIFLTPKILSDRLSLRR